VNLHIRPDLLGNSLLDDHGDVCEVVAVYLTTRSLVRAVVMYHGGTMRDVLLTNLRGQDVRAKA
jgi:hypothetical protein